MFSTGIKVLGWGEASASPEDMQIAKNRLKQPKTWRLMDERSKLLVLAGLRAVETAGECRYLDAVSGIAVQLYGMADSEPIAFSDLEPLWLLRHLPNLPGAHLAIETGFHGPYQTFALAAGEQAWFGEAGAQARRWLARGDADYVIVATVVPGNARAEFWGRR